MKTKFCVKKKQLLGSWYIYRIFLFRSGLSFGTGRSYFYKKLYVLQSIN